MNIVNINIDNIFDFVRSAVDKETIM